jgi:hypothetical protein
MKSMHRFWLVVLFMTIGVAVLRPTLTAKMSSYFFDLSYVAGGSCSNTSINVGPQTYTYNLPLDNAYHELRTLNGTEVNSLNYDPFLAGTGSGVGATTQSFAFTPYPYTFVATITIVFSGGSEYRDIVTATCNNGVLSVTIANGVASASGVVVHLFNDGRLNNSDPAETSAIYCLADGSLAIYSPAHPLWKLAFVISPTEIAKVPAKPAINMLIKDSPEARLYRLSSGDLQVNSPGLGKENGDYVFIFRDCRTKA